MAKGRTKTNPPSTAAAGGEVIPDILASRYASTPMRVLWSPRGRILLERDVWLALMEAQRDLGLGIPAKAIAAYRKVRDQIDLASIRTREEILLHDVKARLEEFSGLAGYEFAHMGMTSRDLTENVEQVQVLRSLRLVRDKAVAALARLAARAGQYKKLPLTARTHNVPAQLTTVGRRLAMFGEEWLLGLEKLQDHLETYPARGLKGAVGTCLDQLTLFGGDAAKVRELEHSLGKHLGFGRFLEAPGQVYPRSLDYETVTRLSQLASAADSFAHTLRLMAGQGLASEGFSAGQVGSSAMPHKVNARNCERIHGLAVVLKGYAEMVGAIAGTQWNEGDVSCSVPRRVALPGAFFAFDGLLETFLTVLGQMEIRETAVRRENDRQMPFLATTTLLMEAVKMGIGRETAHARIKSHALECGRLIAEGREEEADLAARMAGDPVLGLGPEVVRQVLQRESRFVGAAMEQTDAFLSSAKRWQRKYPEAAMLAPSPLL